MPITIVQRQPRRLSVAPRMSMASISEIWPRLMTGMIQLPAMPTPPVPPANRELGDGPRVVPVIARLDAAGRVAELAEHPGSGDHPDAGLAEVSPGVGVAAKKQLHLGFHLLDLLMQDRDHRGGRGHARRVRLGDDLALAKVLLAQRGLDPLRLAGHAVPAGPLGRRGDLPDG